MSGNGGSDRNDLTQTEFKKLEAERRKAQAETRKVLLEAREIRQRLKQKWYRKPYVLEAIIGGFLAAAVITTWVVKDFIPMMREQKELQKVKYERLDAESQRDRLLAEVTTLKANQEKKRWEKKHASLSEDYQTLLVKFAGLARSTKLSQQQRGHFASLHREASLKVEALEKQVRTFASQNETEAEVALKLEEIDRRYDQIVSDNKVFTIPVVVHLVYRTADENISDEQINSQIDVLNADFRARNDDISKVPVAFKDSIGDGHIEFVLATVGPDGNPATGITRSQTDRQSFGSDDGVKSSTSGGSDPWDPSRYLNIWVCTLSGGLREYSQFPGGPAQFDGVVIHNSAFGTIGSVEPPFDKGRALTHGIGHYLNLSHIWGEGHIPTCSDTDSVDDTPNQFGPHFGNPSFPQISCDNEPHGDMFMNFMDYVGGETQLMFTKGQVVRMHATLNGQRRQLGH